MDRRAEAAERLREAVLYEDFTSGERLNAICRAVMEPERGWTREACEELRAELLELLEGGECRNVSVPDEVCDRPFRCSECGAMGPYGNGTYHIARTWKATAEEAEAFGVEEGATMHSDEWPVYRYCPHCGRRVTDDRQGD